MSEKANQQDSPQLAEPHNTVRLQELLLSEMDLPLIRTFYPLGYPVEFMTNHSLVLEAASESFGHSVLRRANTVLRVRVGVSRGSSFRLPPEPTRREYNHLYSLVADVDNQALLDLKTCTNFVWLTEAAIQNRLYFRHNFLEKTVYLLLGASVVTDLHAACVSHNGKGILMFGDSGAGKSTLAYACAREGWTYTSDDTSYLINESDVPRVIGHSHRARFRPSARALFPELERFELTPRLEGKPSIEVATCELPVESTAAEARVHFIVYLSRRPSAKARLLSLANGTATQRACQELYSAGEIREKHTQILAILTDIPTYELEYCDLDEGVHVLDLLTRNG